MDPGKVPASAGVAEARVRSQLAKLEASVSVAGGDIGDEAAVAGDDEAALSDRLNGELGPPKLSGTRAEANATERRGAQGQDSKWRWHR